MKIKTKLIRLAFAVLLFSTVLSQSVSAANGQVKSAEETERFGNTVRRSNAWKKKKCILLGDSIVWYDGQVQTENEKDVIVKGYATYLKYTGITVDNAGQSGACISGCTPEEDVSETVRKTDFSKYDLCIIAAGVNDYLLYDVPLGDFAEDRFDCRNFTQAYQFIIETILSKRKDIRIILFTPLQQALRTGANGQGLELKDYAERVREIGSYYGLPVLDLYRESGLNKVNIPDLTIDMLHPNNMGYKMICEHSVVPFVLSH